MARSGGRWIFVHWKRVHSRKSGAGRWFWRRVWKPDPKPTKLYMYDDVNVLLIPRFAKYVAGYVDGGFLTWLKLKLLFPLAKKVSIAVFASDDADILDVEPRDAKNDQAAAWVKRQRARRRAGAKHVTRLPVVYTAASNGNALNDALHKAGLEIGKDYDWLSAHYDPHLGEHICNPKCYTGLRYTAAATQFTDHADNKNLDESVCSPEFFA